MPRVSRLQSQQHRHAITQVSAKLMRERGIAAVSVADLMAAAGLTHGGFYGHFSSKQALATEACSQAFADSLARWKARIASQPDRAAAMRELFESFLSRRTRDEPGSSCPTVALAGDVAREPLDSTVRSAFHSGTERLLEALTALQPDAGMSAGRRQAIAQFCTLVGAVLLARATAGTDTSDEFLRAAHEHLARPRTA